MKIINNYKTQYNNINYTGSANLQQAQELIKQIEPEVTKQVIGESLEKTVRFWKETPNNKLEQIFHCHDLNLYLKKKNIDALLKKAGAFYYDLEDFITDNNYNLAVCLAKKASSIALFQIREVLSAVKKGIITEEQALDIYKPKLDSIANPAPNANYGKIIWGPKHDCSAAAYSVFYAGNDHYQRTIRYWSDYPDIKRKVENNKCIQKLLEKLRSQHKNLVATLYSPNRDYKYVEFYKESKEINKDLFDEVPFCINVNDL